MQDDIQIIRAALAAGPTPGPWRRDSNGNEYVRAVDLRGTLLASCGGSDQGATDAAYIAACSPDRMERLLARLEAAETALALWEHAYESGCVDADLAAAYKATP